jgi:hypothetical protein
MPSDLLWVFVFTELLCLCLLVWVFIHVDDDDAVLENFDYCFAENGLTAYQSGKVLESQSFINHLGEDRYKKLVNFCLREISELDIPIKRFVLSISICFASMQV